MAATRRRARRRSRPEPPATRRRPPTCRRRPPWTAPASPQDASTRTRTRLRRAACDPCLQGTVETPRCREAYVTASETARTRRTAMLPCRERGVGDGYRVGGVIRGAGGVLTIRLARIALPTPKSRFC